MSSNEILSFDEIARLARLFAEGGVTKLRLTGGEPLLRPNLPALIQQLSAVAGIQDIALTTNGSALEKHATALKDAGLNRLTVSVDALDNSIFQALSDTQLHVQTVLDGLDNAQAAGFSQIKINTVIKRGVNESQIRPLVERFANPGFVLRFIEYMDVGNTNGWRLNDVVSAADILKAISQLGSIEPLAPNYVGETARRYRFTGTTHEFGIIASVTAPFCGNCTRARISANGRLHTCLFSESGLDLKQHLRDGSSDLQLRSVIQSAWKSRSDRYSETRSSLTERQTKTEMSVLGG